MNVYEGITKGLNQAILYNEGNLEAETNSLSVADVPIFTAEEITATRKELKMSPPFFAAVLGVSEDTVKEWECGKSSPEGAAGRLIFILREDPELPYKTRIIS